MRSRRAEAVWIESRQRWQINVQRDGERRTFTSSTAGRLGKHEAEQKADAWLTKFQTEQRLEDAWNMYIADKSQEIKGRAVENLGRYYNHIIETIPKGRRLSMISLYDWQHVLDRMAQDGYSAGTIGQVLSAITALNKYALARRWACEQIHEGALQIPRNAGKAKAKQALSEDSYKALYTLDDTDCSYIYLFQLLPLTGLRIGEALTLKWSDIQGGVLHLSRAMSADGDIGTGKSDNALRNIPLIPQAQSILDEQRAFLFRMRLSKSEYIFPNISTGEVLTYMVAFTQWSRRVCPLIHTDCTLHELRHTYISIVKNTLHLPLLKQIVGHGRSMDTLGVYAHELSDDVQISAKFIEQAFEKRTKTCT